MKRILLTGSTGFVGRNLLEGLREAYRIDAPSRAELDLNDPERVSAFLKGKWYDCIIHASNPSPLRSGDPADSLMLSMLTQYFGLSRMRESYGKLIYFGSGAEYDKSGPIRTACEEEIGARVPLNQYGLAKYLMNQDARASASIYNLRLFGCFGPYEYWPTCFISNAICRTLFGMPISIRQNVFFDYLYIDDVVRAVEWLIEHDPPLHDYNLCSGERVDLKTLARMVVEAKGGSCEIKIKKEGLNLEYTGNCDRLKSVFPSFYVTPLADAVNRLFAWYEQRKDSIIPERILD